MVFANWEPIAKSFLKSALIVGLGTIVHEFGHYVTIKASGGEVLEFGFDPMTGTFTMISDVPAEAHPLIRLFGSLAEAAFYALLSMTDRKLLIPASMCLGFSYSEMEQNQIAMSVLGPLTTLSVFVAQLFNIPDEEIS